jgi:phage-related protein (TIGR01555 family)
LGWGGARPGAGRKPSPEGQRKERNRRRLPATARASKAVVPQQLSFDGMERIIEASQQHARNRARRPEFNPFRLPEFPPAAVPPKGLQMAMDEAPGLDWANTQWAGGYLADIAAEGLTFLGYNFLAELSQRPEYRTPVETIATEMTRKWIKLSRSGEADKKAREKESAKDKLPEPLAAGEGEAPPKKPPTDKEDNKTSERIRELQDFLNDLRVRDHFCRAAEHDGFFGRSHLFIDSNASDEELMTPIAEPHTHKLLKGKVGRNFLKRLQNVEPVWCYPTTYNATNPLSVDWYNPQVWYVMGKQIHRSRLPMFVGRPLPDLLKPAYAFGGLALSQIMKPYVDIWLTTRQSVADLIHSFSVMVLSTDLQTILQPGNAAGLMARAALFNSVRDNAGLMIVNKATEEFSNVSAPLSGLHELQAQSQEHMLSVSRIPAIKAFGIQPQGLNASSEGEMRAFNDTISAAQHSLFKPNLDYVIEIAMVSLWGKPDPSIVWEFESLVELTEKEQGELKKLKAETGQIHIDTGVIDPAEERERIINDPNSDYNELDPDDLPDLKQEEEEGLVPGKGGGEVTKELAAGGGEGGEGGGQDAAVLPFDGAADRLFNNEDLDTAYWIASTMRSAPSSVNVTITHQDGHVFRGGGQAEPSEAEGEDAEFHEEDHPRAPDGKFGKGSGGSSGEGEKASGEAPPGEQPAFQTKKDHARHLLEKGATAKELMKALGWPSISVPATAKSVGMKLEKTKIGKETVYKGVPMTPEERKAAGLMPPGIKRSGGPASRDPSTFSMLEFLASKGGIDPKDPLIGDVRSMIGSKNKFIPGFGMLIRPKGMRLDKAREAAIESGYLTDAGRGNANRLNESTLNTLFDGMDSELRGNKLYQHGQTPEHVTKAQHEAMQEENRYRIEESIDRASADSGIDLDSRQRERVIEIMEKEGVRDPLEAIEREAMEWVQNADDRGEADRILDDIPGWDVPPDARAASQSSGAAPPF